MTALPDYTIALTEALPSLEEGRYDAYEVTFATGTGGMFLVDGTAYEDLCLRLKPKGAGERFPATVVDVLYDADTATMLPRTGEEEEL